MRLTAWLIVVITFSAVAVGLGVLWINYNRDVAVFETAIEDADSIRTRVQDLESMIGLDRWEYDFHLPPQHKLLVILESEFNGEPYPEMSTTYQVVPALPLDDTDGTVLISFYHPNYQTKIPQQPRWTLSITATNDYQNQSESVANSFSFVSPVDPALEPSGHGAQSTGGQVVLKPGQLHEVWIREIRTGFENSDHSDFTIRFLCRVEEISPADEPGSIQDVDAMRKFNAMRESTELLPIPDFSDSASH